MFRSASVAMLIPVVLAVAAPTAAWSSSRSVSGTSAPTSFDGSYQGTWTLSTTVYPTGLAPVTATTTGSSDFTVSGSTLSAKPIPNATITAAGMSSFNGLTASGYLDGTFSSSIGCTFPQDWSLSFTEVTSDQITFGGSTSNSGTCEGVDWSVRGSMSGSLASTPKQVTTQAKVVGQATVVKADGSSVPLEKTVVLEPQDTVETGADSSADLTLPSNDQIDLGPKSDFEFVSTGSTQTLYRQLLGSIRYFIAPLVSSARRVWISTVTAVMSVRGTAFTVVVKGRQTLLKVTQHAVDFWNPKQPGKHVLVRAGFESLVVGSHPPTAPKRF